MNAEENEQGLPIRPRSSPYEHIKACHDSCGERRVKRIARRDGDFDKQRCPAFQWTECCIHLSLFKCYILHLCVFQSGDDLGSDKGKRVAVLVFHQDPQQQRYEIGPDKNEDDPEDYGFIEELFERSLRS